MAIERDAGALRFCLRILNFSEGKKRLFKTRSLNVFSHLVNGMPTHGPVPANTSNSIDVNLILFLILSLADYLSLRLSMVALILETSS